MEPQNISRDAPKGLRQLLSSLFPGGKLLEAVPLGADAAPAKEATAKAEGYGVPIRITMIDAAGEEHLLVLHTAKADDFGHDRRSDRAQSQLLAFDTFGQIPGHVRAVDVGAFTADDRLLSLRDAGEFYVLTTYARGRVYAEDLRRIGREGVASPRDEARALALARYLVGLHARQPGRPALYRRAVRDLLGHGEGIFGIVDGYPEDVAAASPSRLRAIERRCLEWRWRLRGREERLSRTHGDFHPFNVVFEEGPSFVLLDASRGGVGEPADDVAAMAINYLFFALERPAAWARGLGILWRRFFEVYLEEGRDPDLLRVVAPFLAWRGLVLANPRWYPALSAAARDALLGFVERALDRERFDPSLAEALFT